MKGFEIVATSHEIRKAMNLIDGNTVNISCHNEKPFIAIVADKKNQKINGLSFDLLYPAGTKKSSIKTKTNCTVKKGGYNFSELLKKIAGITWTGKKGEKPVPHNPDGSIYINPSK